MKPNEIPAVMDDAIRQISRPMTEREADIKEGLHKARAAVVSLIAERDALLKASEWQDIESAPKDGSWFVIRCDDGDDVFYEVGGYDPSFFDQFVEVENGLYKKEQLTVYEWCGFNNFGCANGWMPLLAPPLTQEPNK